MSENILDESSFPTGEANLDLLHSQGDALEQLICKDFNLLQLILLPYANAWAKHIYPWRERDGAFVVEKRQKFAGHHYTALVRLHHALNAKKLIASLCEDVDVKHDDYSRVLDVHSACASFWDNLGASIDNFVEARKAARKTLNLGGEKRRPKEKCPKCNNDIIQESHVSRTVSDAENPKLFYAFERRNQYIHGILVPKKIDGGMIVFNVRHYGDAATDWSEEVVEPSEINSQIESDWTEILTEYSSTWANFCSWLKTNDTEQAPVASTSATDYARSIPAPRGGVGSPNVSGESYAGSASPMIPPRPSGSKH